MAAGLHQVLELAGLRGKALSVLVAITAITAPSSPAFLGDLDAEDHLGSR
jgi:hypothetical protein